MGSAAIPLQVVNPKINSPLQTVGGLMQIRNQIADIALRNQQVEQAKQQSQLLQAEQQQKNRDLSDVNAYTALIKDADVQAKFNGDGDITPFQRAGIQPKYIDALVKARQDKLAGALTLDKETLANRATATGQLTETAKNLFAPNADGTPADLDTINSRYQSARGALAPLMKMAGFDAPLPGSISSVEQLQQVHAALQGQHALYTTALADQKTQGEIANTAAQTAATNATANKTNTMLPLEAAGAKTKNEQDARVLAGTSATGITAEDQAKNKLAQASLAEEKRLHSMQYEDVQLSPEALQKSAEMFATTGQIPSLGMGAAAAKNRSAIINMAAKQFPNVDFATNKAAFQANNSSLQKLQTQFDGVTAFENTAGKNLDTFLNTAKKVVDSGSPWINQPLRDISGSGLGSADQAAFNAARVTAVTEIGKVLNSANATGVLSDSARHEVDALMGPNASLKQIYAAADILKQDMKNRHDSYADQISAIKQRIGSNGSAGGQTKAAPKATHRYNPATGQIEAVK